MRQIIVVCVLAALCASCATVTRGLTSQVQITSSPSGAHARASTGYTCTTPCTFQVNRKDTFTVLFSRSGYHSTEIPVRVQVAGAGAAGFAGNVIIGGVVGMGVDAATGAVLEHYPNPVDAKMVPVRAGEKQRLIKVTPPSTDPKPEDVKAMQTQSY